MLRSLLIENLAIVTHLELDLSEGMTAFTGETGAGKSIMIDALMLAMGGRADASVIRAGETKCSVSALFTFEPGSEPALWLEAHDLLDADTDNDEIWLRRVIHTEGRSKSYINGQPLPLNKVKALSELLLDIHGQHQHQRLLKPATHRVQLDQYAHHPELLHHVTEHYQTCQNLKRDLAAANAHATDQAHADLLHYQLEELHALELQENEVDELNQEHSSLHHAKTYLEEIEHIKLMLLGDDDAPSIQQNLHHIIQQLNHLPGKHPRVETAAEFIQTALIQCEEAASEIELFANEVHLDPERLFEVEARLSILHQVARKYHVPPEQLLAKQQQLEREQASLEHLEAQQIQLQQAFDVAQANYEQAALALRASREQHAQNLEQDITGMLKQLDIAHGVVRVMITPADTMQPHGLDRVEYFVSTNPGIPPDALAKIASGGELSRISLAIQVITARRASTPTLFFDEVDVGIGGATAARVGKLLRTLGERLQVFCVTHQPQVAAAAHHHMLVKKHSDSTHTFSEVLALDAEEKIGEIARMLGGLHMTAETQNHAKALLLEHA
ncbi:MAG: DNA repair protein RecN [Legionellaceae bacterium]|nr:DNA repair protein RecN [Legionellaceae bacterium]